MDNIIEVNCYEHSYSDKTTVEMCDIEFIVKKAEKVAILGPNGGGKTTLIKHILGMLKPTKKGAIRVFGVDPTTNYNDIREKIGVVLQSVDEQLIGPTVLDDILFAPLNYGYSDKEALKLADTIMNALDITHLKDKIIHNLSGGEKRKVALAGAMVLNPQLLILDEPFSGLDLKSQIDFIQLLTKICTETEISIVLTTHDIDLINDFVDTVYLICSGKTSHRGTPAELFSNKSLLTEFNLVQPSFMSIFSKLKEEGYNIEIPHRYDQACELLKSLLTK